METRLCQWIYFKDDNYLLEWYIPPRIGQECKTIVSIPISKEQVELLEENGAIELYKGVKKLKDGYYIFDVKLD